MKNHACASRIEHRDKGQMREKKKTEWNVVFISIFQIEEIQSSLFIQFSIAHRWSLHHLLHRVRKIRHPFHHYWYYWNYYQLLYRVIPSVVNVLSMYSNWSLEKSMLTVRFHVFLHVLIDDPISWSVFHILNRQNVFHLYVFVNVVVIHRNV